MRETEEGFTLVELLVAITVLALLMVLLFGGVRFGTRAWQSSDITYASTDEIRTTQSLLRNLIARACPRLLPSQQGKVPTVDFYGDNAKVEFRGPLPLSLGGASCVPIALLTVAANGKRDLTLRMQMEPGRVLTRALVANVQTADFAYLGDSGWQDTWANQSAPPRLIRVRVSFLDRTRRVWPELFVRPHITAETDCGYDPTVKGCRGKQ